jgi:NADH:ubiquinone oxidoreductase subunit 6 (subunit J)
MTYDIASFLIGVIFWVLSAIILFSGLMVVVVKDIVHAALWLIASFAGVAGLYFLLEAPFIGVVQILVYTGAVSILVLFAIMLTRHGPERGPMRFERWWIAALVAIGLFAGAMVPTIWNPELPVAEAGQPSYWPQAERAAEPPAEGEVAPQPEGEFVPIAGAREIGVSFMQEYYVPFWAANVLLLVALVGAIVIAFEERTRRRRVLTLAEEAELRRSLAGLGIDRPEQARGPVPPDRSDAGTAERR